MDTSRTGRGGLIRTVVLVAVAAGLFTFGLVVTLDWYYYSHSVTGQVLGQVNSGNYLWGSFVCFGLAGVAFKAA